MDNNYDRYQSPFSWRYASEEMRRIWSENNKRKLWRTLWTALAQVQAEYGLVRPEQVEELRANVEAVDMARALEIEAEIHHDLMAELLAFSEQCPAARGIIHLGATSMDIEDNADALRLRQSLDIVLTRLKRVLELLANRVSEHASTPVMAFTHLQPAEPTTLGYRLAFTAQDLLADFKSLRSMRDEVRGKGFKGAVGTGASYIELVGGEQAAAFENRLSAILDLPFFAIAHQTYPRRQDYVIISALAGLGATLYKFAFDLRLLQSPTIGEWSEPFAEKQVGSSAMPFKRNPIHSEKIDSLARTLAQMPAVAWNNAAHSLLERTLDDSANRRTLLPEAFLITDELLKTAERIIRGLVINEAGINRNLEIYAPFAATERILMALVKAGADRQVMHERLREHAMEAWQAVRLNQPNPLPTLLANDRDLLAFLPQEEITSLLQVGWYTGSAPERARNLAETILKEIESA